MAKEIGKREGRRGSRAGSFFGGTFFGFILCILTLCGIGAFVYFKVSPNWINKTFKTDLDLGTEELNKLTLKDAVSHIISLSGNMDTYTLENLKSDFGIDLGDKLKGIDISTLKSVPLDKLADELQKTLSHISAAELEAELVTNLNMDNILGKENTYYYGRNNQQENKQLYKSFDSTKEEGQRYSDLVTDDDFKYSFNSETGKIEIKGHSFAIDNSNNGAVKIELRYLPLVTALPDFANNLGDKLTLRELKDDYNVNLPSYIYDGNEDATINEMEGIINDMYVADFLEYTIDDTKNHIEVKDKNDQDVTGLIYELAIEKVSNLKNVQDKFEKLTATDIKDIVGEDAINKIFSKTNTYYINGTKLCEKSGTEVTFEYTIDGSVVTVNDETYNASGNEVKIELKNLPIATAITAFTKNMGEILTLDDLASYGVTLPDYIYDNNGSKNINQIESIIDNLQVAKVLGYTIDKNDVVWDNSGTEPKKVTGIMAIISKKTVSELNSVQSIIEDEKIATLLDYTIDENDVVWDNSGEEPKEVTGILGKVALYKMKEVNNVVDILVLGDIFDEELESGVFTLLDSPANIKVTELTTELETALKESSILDLKGIGLLSVDSEDEAKLDDEITYKEETRVLGELSITEFVDYCFGLIDEIESNS